ncbi:galectin-4-like [Triplophysa rosa]|uniref:Galectin n=1 Tax=Triplophysa rosa TaxID=992332 RepID=A0A9W7WZ49_TRIRA|nr:galectin-4-like [Triplophysa rosa]KAI7811147.1 putative galectin-like protein [Triplophysa rosa]
MFQPVFNPRKPYEVQGGLLEGMIITVCGRVWADSERFQVDLQHCSDIVLHVNPRYENGHDYVVHNTFTNGHWDPNYEQDYECPFPRGQSFALQILVTKETYKISANGKPFSEYKHRVLFSRVDSISVSGMVDVNLVLVQYLEPLYAPIPGTFRVPYKSIIYGGLYAGKTILIQGLVYLHAQSLEVNLRHKTGVAFNYCCHLDKNVVVLNNYENGEWGKPEKYIDMPFTRGQPFQMTICCKENHYSVFASDKQVHTYTHQYTELQDIDVLEISGDVQLNFVQP